MGSFRQSSYSDEFLLCSFSRPSSISSRNQQDRKQGMPSEIRVFFFLFLSQVLHTFHSAKALIHTNFAYFEHSFAILQYGLCTNLVINQF